MNTEELDYNEHQDGACGGIENSCPYCEEETLDLEGWREVAMRLMALAKSSVTGWEIHFTDAELFAMHRAYEGE
jgi:ribosome modulation factor